MSQRTRILIGVLILILIFGVFFGLDLIQYLKASSAQGNSGNVPAGSIPLYLNGELVATFAPGDLDHLGMMSFVESEQGKTEEGWLLRDVVLLHVSEGFLTPDSVIIVSSASREKSAQLTWEEIQDLENKVLLDLSGRGTLKLVSRLEKLDTRDEWVQDVDRIEIET